MTEELLKVADNLYAQGRLSEAVEVYWDILQDDPDNIDVFRLIISLSLRTGAWSEVVDTLAWHREAVSADYRGELQLTEEFLEVANNLYAQGRLDEAIEVCWEILQDDPDNLVVRGQIISLSLRTGAWSEVVEQHMHCAEILTQRGDWDEAVVRYREILRFEESVVSQGASLRAAREIAEVKAAIKLAKPEVCLQVGRYFLQRDELDTAVQYLKKSLELMPGRWQSHLVLGEAYMKLELEQEAIEQLQEVSRLAPDEAAVAYEMLGEIFAREGSGFARNPGVWFRYAADQYVKRQEIEAATRVLLRAAEVAPDDHEVLYGLSELYARQREFAEADKFKVRGDEVSAASRSIENPPLN